MTPVLEKPTREVRIGVLGAGVIGQIYAARLWEAGLQVQLLARGLRADELAEHGIRHRCVAPEQRESTVPVPVRRVDEETDIDVLFVAVQAQELTATLPTIHKLNPGVVVTLMNVVDQPEERHEQLASGTLTHAFPGVGGYRESDGTIVWAQVPQQATTVDTNSTAGEFVLQLLERTGLPVTGEPLMQHWLHTHSIFIAGMSAGLLRAGGDPLRVAEDPQLLRDMVAALRNGFAGYRKCGGKIRPAALGLLFGLVPPVIARNYWRKEFASQLGQVTLAPQVRASQDAEVPAICAEALRLTGGHAPRFARWIEPYLPAS